MELFLKILCILVGTGISSTPWIWANSVGLLDRTSIWRCSSSSASNISLVFVRSFVSLIDLGSVPYKVQGSLGSPAAFSWSALGLKSVVIYKLVIYHVLQFNISKRINSQKIVKHLHLLFFFLFKHICNLGWHWEIRYSFNLSQFRRGIIFNELLSFHKYFWVVHFPNTSY